MSIVARPSRSEARAGLLRVTLIVLLAKCLLLVVDPNLRFFMGDSGTYLHTAITGWIPPDRSFLYGWMVGATAIAAESASTLVMLQTLFGVLSALVLYEFLTVGLRVGPALATAAATLFALEPSHLFYERMMMAEAPGFLAFALFFGALWLYADSGRWRWIGAYAALGALAVALRISLLPVVLVLSLMVPLLRLFAERSDDHGRPLVAAARVLLHLGVAMMCTVAAHDYYKAWYGELRRVAPAYTETAGVFRLGLVAPLVQARHFENSGAPAAVLDEVAMDIRDHRNREAQIWSANGIYDVLRRHTHDPETAARKISIKAARDDPFGLVVLGLRNLADYFDGPFADSRMQDDIGRRGPHAEMLVDLRRVMRYDATGMHEANPPVTRWFAASKWWLTACLLLLAPLSLLALWLGWREPGREARALLTLTSLGLVAGIVLFSHIISYRYLHPLPWFVLANLAVIGDWLIRRRATAAGGIPRSAN
jgi:hypothetical protein